MEDRPRRPWILYLVRALFVALTAAVAVDVGRFEVEMAEGPPQRQVPDGSFELDTTTPLQRCMNALARLGPLAILAGALCATCGFFCKAPRKRNRTLWTALGLFLGGVASGVGNYALMFYVYLPSEARASFEQSQIAGTLTSLDQQVPDAAVTTVEGHGVRLAELRGQVVLLNFFATWCGPCGLELPELQIIWNDFHADDGLTMLVIGREETDETVRAFRDEQHFMFPMAADPDCAAFGKFATDGIPRTYLISPDGRIIFQCAGFYEEQMAVLKDLLKTELAKRRSARQL